MSRTRRKPVPAEPVEASIETLTHEGRGLTRIEGKTVFVDGALPGERVRFRYTRRQRRFDEGRVLDVLEPAAERVAPRCAHFGVCGGCSLQHLASDAQIRAKQDSLADVFTRIGQVTPAHWLAPLTAPVWGYRRKARLGVRYVPKKGRTLVGFRERGLPYIADLQRCEVLHPAVGEHLPEIAATIDALSIRERVPQIEVAIGDDAVVLVFRLLAELAPDDAERLLALGRRLGYRIHVQPGGVETVRPLAPDQAVGLDFSLPGQNVRLQFEPGDFTQVNLELNRLMVARALELLAPNADEQVLDLFCGLGNFTLPLARQAAAVLGVEGDAGLIERAQANARVNGIDNAAFAVADLYTELDPGLWQGQRYTKALLDPPRSGALEVLDWLPRLGVERILYISCYPATLARDAGRLVNDLGYQLVSAGVMDMFPHTAHVESMALFERQT